MSDNYSEKLGQFSRGNREKFRVLIRFILEQIELETPTDPWARVTVSQELAEKNGLVFDEARTLLSALNRNLGADALTVEIEYLPDFSFGGYPGGATAQNPRYYLSFSITDIKKLKEIGQHLDSGDVKVEKSAKAKTSLNLPSGTKWEDITIQFIDGENVRILAPRDFFIEVSYKEMGFQNNKTIPRRPNKQWTLLFLLAKLGGRITWQENQADQTVKKTKQLLSEGLCAYFEIPGDPFYSYKKEKGYQLRTQLVPVGGLVEEKVAISDVDDPLGIREELEHQGAA